MAYSLIVIASYLISDNVVYLVIAEKSYPRKLAFSYLDELSKEFATSYGAKVETVRKPYAFVGFGTLLALHWVHSILTCAQILSWARRHGCTRTLGQQVRRGALIWTS